MPAPSVVASTFARVQRRTISTLVLTAVALVLALPAMWGVATANSDLQHTRTTVNGIPVTLIQPTAAAPGRPAVIMLHGFAASSVIMEPLGRVLARAGYIVALPDQRGHGANSNAASIDDTTRPDLQVDLGIIRDWLVQQPGVDAARIGLVGHSMGAGAVVRFAIDNPDQSAGTVSLSLPDATPVLNRPTNLLLLYGANEPERFQIAAQQQLDLLQPAGVEGTRYGDFAVGTAVEVQVIPAVEHITIIWSDTTAQLMLDWLDSSMQQRGAPVADLDQAWLWLLLFLVAGGLLAVPLARILFGPNRPAIAQKSVRGWQGLVITLGSAIAGVVVLGLIPQNVTGVLPVAVAGYLAGWFLLMAIVVAVTLRFVGTLPRREYGPPDLRGILASSGFALAVTALMVVSARVTWATTAFVGPRWWVSVVLALSLFAYFYADAVLVSRPSRRWRIGLLIGYRVIITVVLLAAVALLGAPSILTLLIPFMVLLFAVLGFFAIVVSNYTGLRFAPAIVQSLPLAAIIGSGFPLVA